MHVDGGSIFVVIRIVVIRIVDVARLRSMSRDRRKVCIDRPDIPARCIIRVVHVLVVKVCID